ncbi:transmembrane prolyl 4-hydroxylase-like [Ruditapes philippinarum]|uniref:transmembrane prolyl 4-hydroxylase-like n=1 Tax=Ruditapes philippinarum TaxID=129788 RepID=UPI00295BDA38|nr:transmembrane prolyl 4-hydroxylase-like [Ruditapes philippinarum]
MNCQTMQGFLYIFACINVYIAVCNANGKVTGEGEGFCQKTSDGVTCVNHDDLRLTRIDGMQVGNVRTINADGKKLQMKTLNIKPLVFEIEDFLSDDECDHFIETAKQIGLESSHTENQSPKQGLQLMDVNSDKALSLSEMKLTIENGYDIYLDEEDIIQMYKDLKLDSNNDNLITQAEMTISPKQLKTYLSEFVKKHPEKHSRYSRQAWLYPDKSTDTIFRAVQSRVSQVVDLPMDLIRLSDFQVVTYGVKGHYNAHLDSSHIIKDVRCCDRGLYSKCRICRYMTVLFYLNEVKSGGETAFPFANKESIDENKAHIDGVHHLYKNCENATLRVPPKKGKAVIWYNHFIDDDTNWMGEVDEYTLHGGCPVTEGEKWIANFWIKTNNDKSIDLKKMKNLYSK